MVMNGKVCVDGIKKMVTQTKKWQLGISFIKINLEDNKNIKMFIGKHYSDNLIEMIFFSSSVPGNGHYWPTIPLKHTLFHKKMY